MPELVTLNLFGIPIRRDGMQSLATIGELKNLYIGGVGLSEDTLVQLTKLPHLTCLFVYETPLDDSGIEPLKNLKGLKTLILVGTQVTDSGVASLTAALPDCNIETDEADCRTTWDAAIKETNEEAIFQPPLAIAPFTLEEAKQHQQAWADYLGVPVEFENSIGMKMVLIPPGEFMMGVDDEERRKLVGQSMKGLRNSEGPQHKVTLTAPFYLGAYEVTVGEFAEFVEATKHETNAERNGGTGPYGGESLVRRPEFVWHSPGFSQQARNPVVQVSLDDARAFCLWLSDNEGRRYKIPTEAQWEYACRAGSESAWPFGDDKSELERYAWYGEDDEAPTHPVGEKLPNGFGLFDMLGNVLEWTNDWYAEDYYARSPELNPTGPTDGSEAVLRGGSFKHPADLASPARRCFAFHTKGAWHDIGFRPVMLIDPDKPPNITTRTPAESATPEPISTSETETKTDEANKPPKISWKLRHTLEGHTDEVRSVAFHPKGLMVVSGSLDSTIRVWEVESGKQVQAIQQSGGVYGVAISPNGTLLAAVHPYRGVRLWNLFTGQVVGHLGSQDGPHAESVEFSHDGAMLACCGEYVWLYNLRTQQVGKLPHGIARSVAFSPNGQLLASGASDGSVRLWNTRTGESTVLLASGTQERGSMSVAFSNDGVHLIAGGHGENVNLKVWDVTNSDLQETFAEASAVMAVAMNPTRPILASGGVGDRYRIHLRDMTSGKILAELDGHEDQIRSLAFSPDGKLLVSGSQDKTVRIWEIEMEP